MHYRQRSRRTQLMAGAAFFALALTAGGARAADTHPITIAPQPLDTALNELGSVGNQQILIRSDVAAGKTAHAVNDAPTFEAALLAMLDGTGLTWRREGATYLIVSASDPQSGSAAGDGAEGTVQALIVTAQKREEDIQDVPIAISAFTQEDLTRSQVAGGPDLMTQVPNFTFTKTNFSGYSIQIRGIGTQAISATTDPAVAVAFNNTPFVRNRFFEQEFYDLARVEVLRGPQGTLYGRNATAGVVNIISAKPTFHYESRLSLDLSNYNSSRLEGMINLPLVDDRVALRIAGAWTKRDGYDTNQLTGNRIDGRDLWSTRTSLRFTPTDNIEANLIWEHFQEDDDRLRSGKQLCHTDVPQEVDGFDISNNPGLPNIGQGSSGWNGAQGVFSQGCAATSLYAPESFQTPNGFALPYYLPLGAVFLPVALTDPYVSRIQSNDLRMIESTVDPIYKAKNDAIELQTRFDLTDQLSLSSETAWASDFIFSSEDYNRFNTASGAWQQPRSYDREGVLTTGPNGGIFCDPQIGCSDRLVAVDLSTAKSRHFSQEFRLASNYEGAFNFSLGANYLRYDTEDKYYVFINSLSIISALSPYAQGTLSPYVGGVTDNRECMRGGPVPPDPTVAQPILQCTYMDPNPIGNLNDQGHNYFLSRNPYKLMSYAVFGEAYYNITSNLKLTAGLRWTVDKKEAPSIPSWVLASNTVGYPVAEVVRQRWSKPTGRLTLDWKPELGFTDETLVYGSFAHGYKAGGANPPPYGVAVYTGGQAIIANSVAHPRTFDPEYVNAYEVGSKNTLLDGRLTVNAAAFYYDYKGYQISQIVDRSAVNMNFDAKIWGLELESEWRPLENLRLGLKLGYENTRVADGMQAIDLMDRTAGHSDWVVVRPFPSIPSNCILPKWLFLGADYWTGTPELVNLGGAAGGNPGGCELAYVYNHDPVTNLPYVPNPTVGAGGGDFGIFHGVWTPYPGWDPSTAPNHGEGFFKNLSGNELPNAPHYTATITADYTLPLPSDWLMTLHGDFYYQAEAWARIFNTPGYDKLKAYNNVNFAAIFTNEDAGWKVMAYVKNVFDRTNVTGAFLNSDDTGLTTNVFLNEPRLYGLRVTKEWTGEGWWTGANPNHPIGEPYPLTIELGGMVQRQDAPYGTVSPSFTNSFSSALKPDRIQNQDLDWGDGREVKITYAPSGSLWRISGGLRVGKTNGTNKFLATEVGATGCIISAASCAAANNPKYYFHGTNYTDATIVNREEHTIADFDVGREVGLGGMKSILSAGLRYAQFKSDTKMKMFAVNGWYMPAEYAIAKYSHDQHYTTNLSANREFKGAGPTLSWEAAHALLGDDTTGHVNLDWSVTGGVLFGKQKTSVSGQATSAYFHGKYYQGLSQQGPASVIAPPAARSKSVTAPLLDLSLGLSYEIQRVKVGAGYRWERYYNVLDAGYAERKEYDRTFDGPYFKIAVGFGG
jgi:outer membrane receptor protein involved in Fe transport